MVSVGRERVRHSHYGMNRQQNLCLDRTHYFCQILFVCLFIWLHRIEKQSSRRRSLEQLGSSGTKL